MLQAEQVVDGRVEQERGGRVVGHLGEHAGEEEGRPGVGFGRPLAGFVEGALRDEERHELLDELAEDGDEHEDGEHLVLQALNGVGRVEEDEADEE